MVDAAFNRWDENAIDALSGKRLGECDPGIACCRGDSQKHLRKLSRAARLLFMAIIRFGTGLDRFPKTHPWLDKIEMHVESAAKPLRDNVKMQFALCGNDCLVKFGICHELKRRILSVQRGKTGCDFVLLASGHGLQ